MTSAWGDSWGDAWGDSWGETAVVPQPQPEPQFVGSFGFAVHNDGVGQGVLPALEADGRGRVGRVGRGKVVLPGLFGQASGRAEGAQLPKFVAASGGVIGVAGRVRGDVVAFTGAATAQSGRLGVAQTSLRCFSIQARGSHDPDEAAIVAFLMAA